MGLGSPRPGRPSRLRGRARTASPARGGPPRVGLRSAVLAPPGEPAPVLPAVLRRCPEERGRFHQPGRPRVPAPSLRCPPHRPSCVTAGRPRAGAEGLAATNPLTPRFDPQGPAWPCLSFPTCSCRFVSPRLSPAPGKVTGWGWPWGHVSVPSHPWAPASPNPFGSRGPQEEAGGAGGARGIGGCAVLWLGTAWAGAAPALRSGAWHRDAVTRWAPVSPAQLGGG